MTFAVTLSWTDRRKEDKMSVGEEIKRRRIAAGLTQKQLATRVGTTRVYITYVEPRSKCAVAGNVENHCLGS